MARCLAKRETGTEVSEMLTQKLESALKDVDVPDITEDSVSIVSA